MRSRGNRIFISMHDQPRSNLFTEAIPEFDHLLELVSGVNVKERERQRSRIESFARQMHQHARVFADGIQQDRIPELRNSLPENINRFAFQFAKVCPFLIHDFTVLC